MREPSSSLWAGTAVASEIRRATGIGIGSLDDGSRIEKKRYGTVELQVSASLANHDFVSDVGNAVGGRHRYPGLPTEDQQGRPRDQQQHQDDPAKHRLVQPPEQLEPGPGAYCQHR